MRGGKRDAPGGLSPLTSFDYSRATMLDGFCSFPTLDLPGPGLSAALVGLGKRQAGGSDYHLHSSGTPLAVELVLGYWVTVLAGYTRTVTSPLLSFRRFA